MQDANVVNDFERLHYMAQDLERRVERDSFATVSQMFSQCVTVNVAHHDVGGAIGLEEIEEGNYAGVVFKLSDRAGLLFELDEAVLEITPMLLADRAYGMAIIGARGDLAWEIL